MKQPTEDFAKTFFCASIFGTGVATPGRILSKKHFFKKNFGPYCTEKWGVIKSSHKQSVKCKMMMFSNISKFGSRPVENSALVLQKCDEIISRKIQSSNIFEPTEKGDNGGKIFSTKGAPYTHLLSIERKNHLVTNLIYKNQKK